MNCHPSSYVVRSADQLEPGDHVSWPSEWVGDHHAIIVNVGYRRHGRQSQTVARVIHYNGDGDNAFSQYESASIREDFVDELDGYITRGQLKVHMYQDCECYTGKEAIKRARSRLGESEFNLRTNNCEHFARWCKTGKSVSEQAENVEDVVVGGAVLFGALVLAGQALYESFQNSGSKQQSKRN